MASDHATCTVLGAAILAVIVALWAGPGTPALLAAGVALGVIGLRIIRQDLSTFTIPDTATLAFAIVGAGSRWCEAMRAGDAAAEALSLAALDAVMCGGALLLLREIHYRRRGYDGIGLGDVKLAAAGGILVGTTGFAWSVFGASLVGLAIAFRSRMANSSEGAPRTLAAGVDAEASRGGMAGHPPVAPAPPPGIGDRVAFGALLVPAFWLTWLMGLRGL